MTATTTETVRLEIRLAYTAESDGELTMAEFTDRMFDELLAIGVVAPNIVADTSACEIVVALTTDAPDALWAGLSDVRTAIHACGGKTPGWPSHFEIVAATQVGRSTRVQHRQEDFVPA